MKIDCSKMNSESSMKTAKINNCPLLSPISFFTMNFSFQKKQRGHIARARKTMREIQITPKIIFPFNFILFGGMCFL